MEVKSVITNGESVVGDITIRYAIDSSGRTTGSIVDKDKAFLGNINMTDKGELGIYFNEKSTLTFSQKKKVISVVLSDLEKISTK